MAKKKSFYAKTPAVPEKVIAGSNPIYGPSLGSAVPPRIVPAHPGSINAWGGEPASFGRPSVVHPHGYKGSIRKGHHVRTSGHGGAHMLGTQRPIKTKK